MSDVNKETEESTIPSEFNKIIKDFISDLIGTFPDKITSDIILQHYSEINEKDFVSPEIYEFCKEVYPKRFFDILYEKDDMFEDKTSVVKLLPAINYTETNPGIPPKKNSPKSMACQYNRIKKSYILENFATYIIFYSNKC